MVSTVEDAITDASHETGLDAKLLQRIADLESSGNPEARKSGSKYMGLFQLSQAEFLEFGGGDIFDATDNAKAFARKLRKTADRWLAKHGVAASSFELYMMHQQGWSGLHALQSAPPGQLAWSAVRPYYETDDRAKSAIAGNLPSPEAAGADGMTAAGFLTFWRARLNMADAAETPAEEPVWLQASRRELGTKEGPGGADNARVLAYYRDAGHAEIQHDETAWCAAFVGAMLQRSGLAPSGSLMARSYLKWGVALKAPKVGCIVVFWRGDPNSSSGHVGFYVGTTANGDLSILGGNQADAVSIAIQPKARALGYRWPANQGEKTMSFDEIISDFAPIVPGLARMVGGPAGSVVTAVLADLVDKSGKRVDSETPDQTLKRLGIGEVLPILRAAEMALEAMTPPKLVAVVSDGASIPAAQQPRPPELTVLDKALGLTGYKTYIVLAVAAVVNIAAGLGVAPTLLTPDALATINTGLTALGGATLISKVERYAAVLTAFRRR